jgi:succinate dehydrogenase / fumarate reductase flavoprotein subunit
MLTTAETIMRSALERTESRGAHFRSDYDEKDPAWAKNIRCLPTGNGRMQVDTQDAGAPSDAVRGALNEGHELDYHHLE